MKKRANVKTNAAFNMIKTVFQIIFPLITFPYISRVLHAENVGKVNYASSIYTYIALFASLSISTYAIRTCIAYRDDREKLSEIASQIFSINMVATIIAYIITIVVLLLTKSVETKILIAIYCSNIIFTTLGADWINNVEEDFKFISIRTVAFQFLSLILMFAFVRKASDFYIYAFISFISTSGANIINLFYRKKFCKIKFTLKMNLQRHLSPVMKFFAQVVTQQIYVNSDVIMLGWMSTNVQVGLYSTASKIYNIVSTLIASIFTVVLPSASNLWETESYDEFNRLLRKILLFLMFIGLPCATGLIFASKDILILIAGQEYSVASTALIIFGITLIFSYIHGFIGTLIIIPQGNFNIGVVSAIVSSSVNVVLNIFLIPRWGYVAAAFTTLIAEILACIIHATKIDKNVKIKNVAKPLIHYIIACAVMAGYIYLLDHYMSLRLSRTILVIGGSAVIYFLVLLICRDEILMESLRGIMNKLKRKAA